ncbi:signal peptidase II [Velocimicrobium porci]|uniref:Lipoprotein signal peptidase n=1 Tax=Velocimicrobium porci TaxID=2606634 RepID=A0A6L5XYN8_9FIRM|nr:signal peptidase II [Velocimicrobium porci]MSS63970.1 signal peptidase II [Velocimicrobium porci]
MNQKKARKGVSILLLLVIIDQATKQLAKYFLEGTEGLSIIPGVFSLQYLENRGAAFGIFQNKTIFLVVLTLAIMLLLCYVYIKLPDTKHYLPMEYTLILIASGAIGNFIDRIINRYVIDFFYFELIDFPIFNVADCYVTVATILLLLLCLFYYKEDDFTCLSKKKGE